jgi:hypothetical protein
MHCWPPLPLKYIEEGENPFIIIHSYHSCVRDVTTRSTLVFLSFLDIHLYFISVVLESLGFLAASCSILNTRARIPSFRNMETRVLK